MGVGGTAMACGRVPHLVLIGKYHLIHLPPDVFMVSAVPARLYPSNFLLVAVSAIALCMGARSIPALQARTLSPVEVIRYE